MQRLLLLCVLLFAGLQSYALKSSDKVKWTFAADKINDTTFQLVITAKLDEGWHIFSFTPGGDGSMLPPEFNFSPNAYVKLLGKMTESGKKIEEDTKDVMGLIYYYKNKIVYTQKLLARADTDLKGVLTFMVCDDNMCLPPEDLEFSISIKGVVPPANATIHTDTSPAADSATTDTEQTEETTIAAAASDSLKTYDTHTEDTKKSKGVKSLWSIFLTGLVSGFVAFVTPCIFSMLPITVSFFTKRSKTKAAGLKNATFYSLSIISIFLIVGVMISLFFKENTMYVISSSIWFNLFVFVVFLVFGISLLGAFEITLPSSWSSKLDSKANANSFGGIFFMALVLVVVSFSCTSAFISWLIVDIVQSQNRLGGIMGFLGFGLAIALPFAFFAYFPGLLNSLAKSGGWLNSVKVTMGFLELGLAMKFLSNVDLQYHWHLLNYDVYISIWIALAGLLGLYLIGKIKFSHDDDLPKNMFGQPYLSITRLFFAIASFSFMVYMLPGLWGAPLTSISGLLPERKTLEFNLHDNILGLQNGQLSVSNMNQDVMPVKYTTGAYPLSSEIPGVAAYFDYEEALAASKKLNKPVLLDFTGHSCINCRKMERAVLSKPVVLKSLREDFIVASLYCDDRQPLVDGDEYISVTGEKIKTLGSKNLDIEVNKYGEIGQPIYIFVDGDGQVIKNAGGYVDDVQRFLNIMEEVKAAYKKANP